MGEREAEVLRDELVPEEEEEEEGDREDFSLDTLDMLRVIGTGTFARVCLCQVSCLDTISFCTPSLTISFHVSYCESGHSLDQTLII